MIKNSDGSTVGDIYGQSPPVDESPTIVASKLKDFDAEIDLMPSEKKQGYAEAQEKCFNVATDKDLKLMFLRCEKFHAKVRLRAYLFVRCAVVVLETNYLLILLYFLFLLP